MSRHACLLAILGLVLAVGEGWAAAPPVQSEPLKGAVTQGFALTCVRDYVDVYAHFQPLKGGRAREVPIAYAVAIPARWTLSRGVLWVNGRLSRDTGEGPTRYELAELFKGRIVTRPGGKDYKDRYPPGFARAFDIDYCQFASKSVEGFSPVWHSDYVPDGRFGVKLFLLTNLDVDGRQKGPKWSLACKSVRAKWNGKRDWPGWETEEWIADCVIDVRFREPFQALVRGEDYYFLTASGKLYRAPEPPKPKRIEQLRPPWGSHRKMVTIWDDERAPIKAHLTHVDRNRTFLFCDNGPKGKGGPCVFELADGVRLRHYDPKLYKLGDQGPDSLRKVVGYARVLEALGYVEDRSPAKTSTKGKR